MQMLKEKSGFAIRRFISSMLFLHAIAFLLHLVEITVTAANGKTIPTLSIFAVSLLNDITFIARYSMFVFPAYLIIYWGSDFLARMLMGLALVITTITLVGLMQYYLISNMILGADLWNYSWHDIKLTIKASANLSWWQLVVFPLFVGLSMRAHYWFQQRTFSFGVSAAIACSYIIIGFLNTSLQFIQLDDVNNKTLAISKGDYFLKKTTDFINGNHLNSPYLQQELMASLGAYPFQYQQKNDDELGPFLNKTSNTPPNIVFVIVEGLGKTFVGPNADYKGCMPYLDSLSEHSLFWTNFLSTTGRTFGVLPSILGSLPFGKGGFMETDNYPNHTSLYKLLKQNGYKTGFFYGGDVNFDGQKKFLDYQGVETILDENNFTEAYEKIPKTAAGFSWGYPDKALYKRSMELLPKKGPFFNVYLTVTTHEPFIINNPELYDNQLSVFIRNHSNPEVAKNKDAFRTLMYADDAIRQLIDAYKKRPDFNNTIFVITGDHRMIPINHKSEIDRYHVPFIIYSPMLNTQRVFKSISSHADVPATFTSFLKNKYQLNFPDSVHWLGKGLSFNTAFVGEKHIPIMRNKGQISDYVFGKYFITDGALQNLSDNLIQTQNRDIELTKKVADYLEKFKQLNEYVCNSNKLYNVNFSTSPIVFDSLDNTKFEEEKLTEANIDAGQNHTQPTIKNIPKVTNNIKPLKDNQTVKKSSSLEAAQINVIHNSEDADAYYKLGLEHLKEGNISWARANLEKSIALNYKQKKVYVTLIDLELLRNDNEAARAYYYKAIGVFGKEEFETELEKIKNHKKINK
jgi:phosphoglycerol transferase MdoB-like AlkP superfamily enzyme